MEIQIDSAVLVSAPLSGLNGSRDAIVHASPISNDAHSADLGGARIAFRHALLLHDPIGRLTGG
jgi:hypothetical protein